jgi:hypothetical protein
LKGVSRLDETLNDEGVVVSIHDKTGQEVAFGVDPAAQNRIDGQPFPQMVGLIEAAAEKSGVGFPGAARQESKRDLRFRAVEGRAESVVAFVAHGDDASRLRVSGINNVAAIDPQMTAPDAVRPTFPDNAHI